MKSSRLTRSGLLLAVLVSAVALAGCADTAALEPQLTANEYNTRGVREQQMGDLGKAIADYTKAIRLDPQFATAYNSRGTAEIRQGDFGDAIADFTKAIELKPDYATAYRNRGSAKRRNGDFDGAMADLDKAIELEPDFPPAYINRGNVKLARRDFDGAIADFTKAMELDPKLGIGARMIAAAQRMKKNPKEIVPRTRGDELEDQSFWDNQRLVNAGVPNNQPLPDRDPRQP